MNAMNEIGGAEIAIGYIKKKNENEVDEVNGTRAQY